VPKIDELPYVNHSHFEALLSCIDQEDIVTIFTHLLFESKTLLIAQAPEHLVPLSFALHSLIYPFKMCIFVPCIMNDGEEVSLNSLNMICSPVNYFMGICQDDKEMAYEILREDTFPPPLIIDIECTKKKEVSNYCLFTSGAPIVLMKKCLKLIEN
jgi:hypothetical protein